MFGLTYDRVIRWCVSCSHHHDGSANLESAAVMVEKNRQAMIGIREAKAQAAREEVEAWKRKQQNIFEKGSAQWEARLAEMLDPSQDTDSIPGSAALMTKAGRRKQQAAMAAKLAEQRAEEERAAERAAAEQRVAPVAQHPLAEEIKAAAKAGDVGKVEALLDQGVPVDVTDDTGYTPLYHGTMYGKEEVVATCIKHGASVDKENNNGVTPIMAAARDGVTAIVKMLLEAGSDPYQLDEFGRTPATVAESKGFEETSKLVADWCEAHAEGFHESLIIKPPASASSEEPAGTGAQLHEDEEEEDKEPNALSEVPGALDGAVASTNQSATIASTASDFAGMEARTKFFDVFKQESKRRQEEGSLQCEDCVILAQKIVEATAKEDFETVERLREENPGWTGMKRAAFGKKGATRARWCEGCATKDHPETVDMVNDEDELLDALTVDIESPRRKFLADCESQGLPPLPLLIWEDDEDKRKVRLNKFRLGDKLIAAYAHGLLLLADSGVPIEELHMEACAMYDDGVIAVTGAFVKLSLLTVLDLSKNRIGKRGGEALAAGLKVHKCIKEVNLASCRLSDHTGGGLMTALKDHCSLTSLDLSGNTIGSTQAGFHPLVELIEYQGLLNKLNFSWNSINGSAMKALATSLKTNFTLTEVDISWNSIQDEGALALASALRFNNTLLKLNIAHNDIKERGGMVLGDMLKENRGLKKIVFDDNPLGPRGGRGILRGLRWMCEYGIKRTMLFSNCNFTSGDKRLELFDPTDPAGVWDCSLDDPYQRTVANELVELAWTQPGENWKDETLEIDGKKEAYELIEPKAGQVLTREDFKLPEEGVLSVTYVPTARVSRRSDVLTAATFFELINLINRSENDVDRVALVKLAGAEFYFTAEHSATLMTMFPAGGMLRVDVAASLLPRTVDVVNWNREIFNRLNDGEMSRLAQKMGSLFHFSPRNPTNQYHLELSKQSDRVLFRRLIEGAREERDFRRVRMQSLEHLGVAIGGAINSSQKGDFDNWRNEKIKDGYILNNDVPEEMNEGTGTWETLDIDEKNPPIDGTIVCDYVSTNLTHRLTKVDTIPARLLQLLKMDMKKAITTVRLSKHGMAKRSPQSRGTPGSTRATPSTPSKGVELDEFSEKLEQGVQGAQGKGWWRGGEGEGDGISSPMSRPTSRASSRGSPPNSRPASRDGMVVLPGRPDSRDGALIEQALAGVGGSGDVSGRSVASNSSGGSTKKGGKKKKKKKKKVGVTLSDEEVESMMIHAAIQIQKVFRGYLARWHDVHPKLHSAGMAEADHLERDRGWGYYLREWQALDTPVEMWGVTKTLTVEDLRWAAGVFQKLWRGRCVRLVLQRSRVKEMEKELAGQSQSKRWANVNTRPCWKTGELTQHVAFSEADHVEVLTERCASMVRRSTMCYYFTAAQASAVLEVVPPEARLDCLIALWGVVTDLERLHVDEILEGSDPEELMDEAAVEARKAEFYHRIGTCNGFNPYLPDGYFNLNLRHPGQRAVASMLVRLGVDEPGVNFRDATYNGMPISVGERWGDDSTMPDIGSFCTYYTTGPGCAALNVRIELANRLLMPGKGRWKCIPSHLVVEDHLMNPDCFEIDGWEEDGQEMDDDGSLHVPPPITVEHIREQHEVAAAAAVAAREAALKKGAACLCNFGKSYASLAQAAGTG